MVSFRPRSPSGRPVPFQVIDGEIALYLFCFCIATCLTTCPALDLSTACFSSVAAVLIAWSSVCWASTSWTRSSWVLRARVNSVWTSSTFFLAGANLAESGDLLLVVLIGVRVDEGALESGRLAGGYAESRSEVKWRREREATRNRPELS